LGPLGSLAGAKKISLIKSVNLPRIWCILSSLVALTRLVFSGRRYGTVCLINERTLRNQQGQYRDSDFDIFLSDDCAILVIPDLESQRAKLSVGYKNVIRLDFLFCIEVLAKRALDVTFRDPDNVALLEEKLALYWNLNVSLKAQYNLTRIRDAYLSWLFNRIRPSKLVVKSSYSALQKMACIQAKLAFNADIVEIQHSFIYENHPGYIKPRRDIVDRFILPNTIMVADELSLRTLSSMSWQKEVILNSNWLKEKGVITKPRKTTSKKITVLVISQSTVLWDLTDWINNLVEDCEVFIKLHPRGVGTQTTHFRSTINSGRYQFVEENRSLDECFIAADVVVGSYSTALYEAMLFGKRVLVINGKGCKVFHDFIAGGSMSYIPAGELPKYFEKLKC
jgi:hypothetical protein